MVQKYFDDEDVSGIQLVSESSDYDYDGTTSKFYRKRYASLKKEKFAVLVQLTGTEGPGDDRPGLDIVIVLDISGSMRGKNLENMKIATKFLVKKLSPVDRLSVVTFSNQAQRLCPLTLMTQDAQSKIESQIQSLSAHGGTNITAGLEEAMQVINDRRFTSRRDFAIMFMSDGNPSKNYDGSHVNFGDVPVHTFGLGQDYHPKVLKNIAERSKGGTFNTSDVENPDTSSLSKAFALCLGGLLSVVVKDLTLAITRINNSEIVNVSAGNYPQTRNDEEVTISLGNLYSRESRNILVDLVLAEVQSPKGMEIMEYTYTYKKLIDGVETDVPPTTVTVTRTDLPLDDEVPEILNEKARTQTAAKMKDARILADDEKFDDAKGKLAEAHKDLEGNKELDQSDPLIKGLQAELKQFAKLMETPDIYEKLGRAFAFASELSHALQRASARGDVNELRLFATKAMEQVLEQVQNFEKNPDTYVVPSAAADSKERVKEEKAKAKDTTVSAVADILSKHLEDAIKALKAIQDVINKSR